MHSEQKPEPSAVGTAQRADAAELGANRQPYLTAPESSTRRRRGDRVAVDIAPPLPAMARRVGIQRL